MRVISSENSTSPRCVYVRRRTPVAALASQAFSVKTKQLNLEIQDVGPFCRLLRKKKEKGGGGKSSKSHTSLWNDRKKISQRFILVRRLHLLCFGASHSKCCSHTEAVLSFRFKYPFSQVSNVCRFPFSDNYRVHIQSQWGMLILNEEVCVCKQNQKALFATIFQLSICVTSKRVNIE